MKIRLIEKTLCIDNGAGGRYEIPISEMSGWKLVAEENGSVYFSFSVDGFTQHVSVVTNDAIELKRDISELTCLLGREPLLDLKTEKLPSNFNKYSGVITMELLCGVLAASSGC